MPACVSSSRKECKSLSNRGPTMLQPTKKPPNFLSPQLKKKKKNVEKVEITSKNLFFAAPNPRECLSLF